ncbi:MAG: ribonuclease Y [Armatimonadota bacterium]
MEYIVGGALAVFGAAVGFYMWVRANGVRTEALIELKQREAAIAQREGEVDRQIESRRKELDVEAKEAALGYRNEVDAEFKEKRADLNRLEKRLDQKEDGLDRRLAELEEKEKRVASRQAEVDGLHAQAEKTIQEHRTTLERIASLSREDARAELRRQVEDEMRHETARLIKGRLDEAEREAERRARDIVTLAVQRCAVDQVATTTVSVVPLPSDDIKGRIIGREGRNIRAFEGLTGVDLIIDDTPEAVVVSCFDPVRREVARVALTALITDGRVHPGRIEEMVCQAKAEVDLRMKEAAEEALLAVGSPPIHAELVKLLGKLKFRTSYGQNVLAHSVEMAHLAGMMAGQLGLNVATAKRGALLHDIGKAVDFETEGHHAAIGTDLARRYGESEEVINCIEAHHEDAAFGCLEAVLVQAADAISASRPGARRESLETYIKRLEGLEKIAESFKGVEKCYAIQAGREIRVIVNPDAMDDALAATLARDVARRIEGELQYPGEIRVTVIREVRAVEYAK